MNDTYTLTPHAHRRILARRLPVEHVLAAVFDGRLTKLPDGREARRACGVVVIVNPTSMVIITAWRSHCGRR